MASRTHDPSGTENDVDFESSDSENENEVDFDGPGLRPALKAAASGLSANARMPVAPPQPCEQRGNSDSNKDWVWKKHEDIQKEILQKGICACKWGPLLEEWKVYIKDVPYECVEVTCAKQILQYARLTYASASPMNYETLRRLGKDLLVMPDKVDDNLLERMKPNDSDSKWYRRFYGNTEWTLDQLKLHLKNVHDSANIKIDESQEKRMGFIVTHVKRSRYSEDEMQAIVEVGR